MRGANTYKQAWSAKVGSGWLRPMNWIGRDLSVAWDRAPGFRRGRLHHPGSERQPTRLMALAGPSLSAQRADIAFFASVGVGLVVLALFGILQDRLYKLGSDDFAMIWGGPRAVLHGLNPYDVATWRESAVRVGAIPGDTDVFGYPPWVVLGLIPFALISPSAAGLVWTGMGIALAVVAVRALLRAYLPGMPLAHATFGTILILSPATVSTLLLGQWTFVLLASLVAVVLLLREGRPRAAGILAAVLLVKPPPFVFTGAALAVRALWPGANGSSGRRFVISAAVMATATISLSWILIPSWWPAWLVHSAGFLIGIQPVTLPTLFMTLFGPAGVWVACGVLLAATIVAVQFHPRGDGWLPVCLALSSVGVIYSNTYDLLFLIVPAILAAGALASRSPRRAAFVVAAAAALLFAAMWYLETTHVRLYAASVSLALFAVITAALWPERRRQVGRPDLVASTRSSPHAAAAAAD